MTNPVYLEFQFPDTQDIDVLIRTLQDLKNTGYNIVHQGVGDVDGGISYLSDLSFTAEKSA